MIKKYLYPSIEVVEIGPQISTWMRWKKQDDLVLLVENWRSFCLAKAHTSQALIDWKEISGY